MNIINKSKVAFVALFAINALNSQVFAADEQRQVQERGFWRNIEFGALAAAITITSLVGVSSLFDTETKRIEEQKIKCLHPIRIDIDSSSADIEHAKRVSQECEEFHSKQRLKNMRPINIILDIG